MKICILAIGSIKEQSLRDIISSKLKGMKYEVEIITIDEEREAKNGREREIQHKLSEEGVQILAGLRRTDYVVSLAIEGKLIQSGYFVNLVKKAKNSGKERIVLIIGGSNGISDEVKQKSNELISLSRMTFPHQLTRAILLDLLGELNG